MPDSTLDILIKALEDEKAGQWREIFAAGTDKTFTIKIIGGDKIPGMGGAAPGAANSNLPGGASAGTYNNLNMFFMRDSLKHFKEFPKFTKSMGVFTSTVESMITGISKGL